MTPRDFVLWLQGVMHCDSATSLKGDVFAEVRRRLFAVADAEALGPTFASALMAREAERRAGLHDTGPRDPKQDAEPRVYQGH